MTQPRPSITCRVVPSRPTRETGNAVVEFSWLALLLLVPLVYTLITVFDIHRSALGGSQATSAAGRAFQLAPDEATGRQRATEAARIALADQKVAFDPSMLTITCDPECLQPGSTVTITIAVLVALPLAPDELGSIPVTSTYTEPFGKYRG